MNDDNDEVALTLSHLLGRAALNAALLSRKVREREAHSPTREGARAPPGLNQGELPKIGEEFEQRPAWHLRSLRVPDLLSV